MMSMSPEIEASKKETYITNGTAFPHEKINQQWIESYLARHTQHLSQLHHYHPRRMVSFVS
jgi:hypothetical protein